MITVVIRNKNQEKELDFLLKNLTQRYLNDIGEIIVIDNLSTDNSEKIASLYNAQFVTIKNFSYGKSANLAAEVANNNIIVIFSAHSYPVSHDFFKEIKVRFIANKNLAGLRCLHNSGDFKNYINNISAKSDPNKSGLIFCGSAFNKEVWKKHPFKSDIQTMEDKEWTLRVIKAGFDIEFSPSIFCYDIKRNHKQNFFRYKNEVIGSYQLWHNDITFKNVVNSFLGSILNSFKTFFINILYTFKRFYFLLKFIINKPEKF
ncbi:MAG: glycosyltransferase [Lutibacter sp.]|nr:glycosyltransferase [Lutibacter sp.]